MSHLDLPQRGGARTLFSDVLPGAYSVCLTVPDTEGFVACAPVEVTGANVTVVLDLPLPAPH